MAKIVQLSDEDGAIYPVSNTSGNNYCKMPDGTLIQWGQQPVDRNSGLNTAEVTFNIAFASAPNVQVRNMTGLPERYIPSSNNLSRTGFTAQLYNTGADVAGYVQIYWLAIGRWK